MARENYQEHVFQFDWSVVSRTLYSLFPIFIDVRIMYVFKLRDPNRAMRAPRAMF
jgi:hypothetical protein